VNEEFEKIMEAVWNARRQFLQRNLQPNLVLIGHKQYYTLHSYPYFNYVNFNERTIMGMPFKEVMEDDYLEVTLTSEGDSLR
jgi:hypothetical protein